MALIKCKDCGKEVSSSATQCPSCGCPTKKKLTAGGCLKFGCLLILIAVVLSAIIGNMNSSDRPTRASQPSTPAAPFVPVAAVEASKLWKVGSFTDKFNNPTGDKYVINSEKIIGKFSNTATQDSPLGVELLIDSAGKVAIFLYEYNRKVPVKGIGLNEGYKVSILYDGISTDYLRGKMNEDRIAMGVDSADILKALMSTHLIKFHITCERIPTDVYNFSVISAGFPDAFKQIKK